MSLLGAFILYLAAGVLMTSLLIMAVRYVANSGKITSSQRSTLSNFESSLEANPYFVLVVLSVLWLPILVDTLILRKKP